MEHGAAVREPGLAPGGLPAAPVRDATEGAGVILPLAVPVLVCLVPLLVPARHRRAAAWGSAAILAAGVVISVLSIGVFFLPSVILLAVGAGRSRS